MYACETEYEDHCCLVVRSGLVTLISGNWAFNSLFVIELLVYVHDRTLLDLSYHNGVLS